jgi:hypothetical protein
MHTPETKPTLSTPTASPTPETKTDSKAAVANSTERAHHPYSPSTLQNTEACPHYQSRDSQNERSIAGTLAHGVVETGDDHDSLSDWDALAAVECIEFKEERFRIMEETAQKAFEDACVRAAARQEPRPDPAGYRILSLTEIYLPVDDCKFADCEATTAGYVDYCVLNYDRTHAELLDWKFGRWPVEDADRNLQGIAYTLGLFRKYPSLKTVTFWFKQPLIKSLTHATFYRSDIPRLYLRVQTVVARARKARELMKKNDWSMAVSYVPVCNFCKHIGDCPVVAKFALQVAKKFAPVEFPADIESHKILDPHQTTLAMKLATVVKIWADGFRGRVTARVLEGRQDLPEGYEIAQSNSRRTLASPEAFKQISLKYVDAPTLEKAASYTFGDIEEAISTAAPRGKKQSTVAKFQQELIEKGAVKPGEPYTFLKVKAEKKETKETGCEKPSEPAKIVAQ